MNASALSFQDIILKLQHFWASKGCVVIQPYDSEVGAGTFHTATLARLVLRTGAPAMPSPVAALPTAVTARIPTACSTIISSRS